MTKIKFGKWLGAAAGWYIGDYMGAIFGFIAGSVFDAANVTVKAESGNISAPNVGSFATNLLILSAAVMRSDGKTLKSELDFVKRFLVQQFGEASAQQQLLMLQQLLKQDISLPEVCAQIRHQMPYSQRLQLVHYLFGIAKADGHVVSAEKDIIATIANYLGLNTADFNSLKAMYYRDTNSDFNILEITANATDDEVKKAYRKMAVKYHPDKVAALGDEVQKAANEKFQKVQEAYENIKKQRGFT